MTVENDLLPLTTMEGLIATFARRNPLPFFPIRLSSAHLGTGHCPLILPTSSASVPLSGSPGLMTDPRMVIAEKSNLLNTPLSRVSDLRLIARRGTTNSGSNHKKMLLGVDHIPPPPPPPLHQELKAKRSPIAPPSVGREARSSTSPLQAKSPSFVNCNDNDPLNPQQGLDMELQKHPKAVRKTCRCLAATFIDITDRMEVLEMRKQQTYLQSIERNQIRIQLNVDDILLDEETRPGIDRVIEEARAKLQQTIQSTLQEQQHKALNRLLQYLESKLTEGVRELALDFCTLERELLRTNNPEAEVETDLLQLAACTVSIFANCKSLAQLAMYAHHEPFHLKQKLVSTDDPMVREQDLKIAQVAAERLAAVIGTLTWGHKKRVDIRRAHLVAAFLNSQRRGGRHGAEAVRRYKRDLIQKDINARASLQSTTKQKKRGKRRRQSYEGPSTKRARTS